jgi:hypothetical protein
MRLVLQPKVYWDIDELMGYYERVATPGLAEEFYTELRYFMTNLQTSQNLFQSGSVISGERIPGGRGRDSESVQSILEKCPSGGCAWLMS